jgi:hypothetical protein
MPLARLADPFTELEWFNPRSNDWLLFSACVDYLTAYKCPKVPFEISAYFTWFLKTNPDIMKEGHPLTDVITKSPSFEGLGEKSPDQQRQWAADMLRQVYEHLERRPPVTGLRSDPFDVGVTDNTVRTIPEYWR